VEGHPHLGAASLPERRWVGAQDQEEHGPRTPCRANARASTTTTVTAAGTSAKGTTPLVPWRRPSEHKFASPLQIKSQSARRIRFALSSPNVRKKNPEQ